ncbi:hypothetical protein CNMCM8689_006779 [Aspergillus fumigatus]|nr:hypothetical protein CNMCM8689_006779 [Aspergillus fumigatus]
MAVTALQLATTALEKTATAGTDAAGFKSGCSGMTAADLDEDLLTPGAEFFLPANGRDRPAPGRARSGGTQRDIKHLDSVRGAPPTGGLLADLGSAPGPGFPRRPRACL